MKGLSKNGQSLYSFAENQIEKPMTMPSELLGLW